MGGFDWNEIRDVLPAIVAAVIAFVAQLILCLKVRRVWVRLIPTILTVLVAAGLFVMIFFSSGWDAVGYLLLAILACIPAAACIAAWVIYFVVRLIQKLVSKR